MLEPEIAMMHVNLQPRLLRNQNQVRAFRDCLIDGHDVFHAEFLGLTRTGNDASSIRAFKRHHPHRLSAQFLIDLLFDRRKEAVKVQVHAFNGRGQAQLYDLQNWG